LFHQLKKIRALFAGDQCWLCTRISLSHFPSRLQNCVKVCDARDLTRAVKNVMTTLMMMK